MTIFRNGRGGPRVENKLGLHLWRVGAYLGIRVATSTERE